MSETTPKPALDGLTGLRFVAALHVALYHYADEFVHTRPIARFIHGGYAAVSLFFVLSGFVLTYTYGDRFGQQRITRRSFWLARAARLYPLYLLLVALEVGISLFAYHLGRRTVLLAAIAHVAMLQSWLPTYMDPGNRPGWSIGAEAFFYLLFPWIVVRFYRTTRRGALLLQMLLTWGAGMCVALIPVVFGLGDAVVQLTMWCPLARCFEFLLGIATARLWLMDGERTSARRNWFTAPALALVAILTTKEPWFPATVFGNGVLAPLYAAVIYGLASGGAPRILRARPLVVLGEASFALYLIQQPVFHLMDVFGMPVDLPRFRFAYFVILILASIVVHHLVERPLQGWIRGGHAKFRATLADRPRDLAWLLLPIAVAIPLAAAAHDKRGPHAPRAAFSVEAVPGAERRGFYGLERTGDVSYRWTNGDAVLRVPLHGAPPKRLWLRLQSDLDRHATATISVNRSVLFSGPIPRQNWAESFPLDSVDFGESSLIEIRTSTFRPTDVYPDATDRRLLGVRVFDVSLE